MARLRGFDSHFIWCLVFINKDAYSNPKTVLSPNLMQAVSRWSNSGMPLWYIRHLVKGTNSNSLVTSTTANRVMWVQIPDGALSY